MSVQHLVRQHRLPIAPRILRTPRRRRRKAVMRKMIVTKTTQIAMRTGNRRWKFQYVFERIGLSLSSSAFGISEAIAAC